MQKMRGKNVLKWYCGKLEIANWTPPISRALSPFSAAGIERRLCYRAAFYMAVNV